MKRMEIVSRGYTVWKKLVEKADSRRVSPLPFTAAEVERLSNACAYTIQDPSLEVVDNPNARRDRAFILARVETGLSVAKMCDLFLSDIDWVNGTMLGVKLSNRALQCLQGYIKERFGSWKGQQKQALFIAEGGDKNISMLEYNHLMACLEYLTDIDVSKERFPKRDVTRSSENPVQTWTGGSETSQGGVNGRQ